MVHYQQLFFSDLFNFYQNFHLKEFINIIIYSINLYRVSLQNLESSFINKTMNFYFHFHKDYF